MLVELKHLDLISFKLGQNSRHHVYSPAVASNQKCCIMGLDNIRVHQAVHAVDGCKSAT